METVLYDLPLTHAGKRGKYLYMIGGYYSEDTGCPPWGTSDPSLIRWIGDRLGELVIAYADGTTDVVPLVLGYTLWMHSTWCESPAPFFGPECDPVLAEALRASLGLWGGWEKCSQGVLRVALPPREVASVAVRGVPGKRGEPVFTKAAFAEDETLPAGIPSAVEGLPPSEEAAAFFADHTLTPGDLVPEKIRAALGAICHALHTCEADFASAPETFARPEGAPDLPYTVTFTGGRLAAVATGNVYHNMVNLRARTDEDGFIHTSYENAPSWRYDGFGPYVMRANSYYDSFYSRDAARAIMTLNSFGECERAAAACDFGNRWMMTYPEDGVTLGGILVPGHFSVIPNKPYFYSKVLTTLGVPALCDDEEGSKVSGWPTRYTKERFGEEYQNLGNQETDGHGLMMMANYLTWCNRGRSPEEVRARWTHVSEAAKWILWCFDHPELSFVENDLLYGETEAAMNTYTLYSNLPCFLGLCGYAEMAEAAGEMEEASRWRACADRLRGGITRGFAKGEGWKAEKFGFFHDPVPTMLADIYGYDLSEAPADLVERSRASYPADRDKTVRHGYYGAAGIGYDHSMITQNALLLDRTQDATRFLESLCKLCYSPRLPEPYLVPEGLCVDVEKGVLRRQGDLGNLVQVAEAMKCWHVAIGVSPARDGMVRILPRLPAGWGVSLRDFPVANTNATLDMDVSCPSKDRQSATITFHGVVDFATRFRFGPFPTTCGEVEVTLNGQTHRRPTEVSGDASWAWVDVIDVK